MVFGNGVKNIQAAAYNLYLHNVFGALIFLILFLVTQQPLSKMKFNILF